MLIFPPFTEGRNDPCEQTGVHYVNASSESECEDGCGRRREFVEEALQELH